MLNTLIKFAGISDRSQPQDTLKILSNQTRTSVESRRRPRPESLDEPPLMTADHSFKEVLAAVHNELHMQGQRESNAVIIVAAGWLPLCYSRSGLAAANALSADAPNFTPNTPLTSQTVGDQPVTPVLSAAVDSMPPADRHSFSA
jgi:hypothetical protein